VRTTHHEIVTFKDGFTAPLAVLQLVWNLEDRGIDIRVDGPDLVLNPPGLVTARDLAQLRALSRTSSRSWPTPPATWG